MEVYKNETPLGSTLATPITMEGGEVPALVLPSTVSRKSKWAQKSQKQSGITLNARRKGPGLAPNYIGMPKDKAFWLDEIEDFYPFFELSTPYPDWFEDEFPRATRDDGFLIFDSLVNEVLIWSKDDKEWKIKY